MGASSLLGLANRTRRFGLGFYDDMGDVASDAEEAAASDGGIPEWRMDQASPPPMTATSIAAGVPDASTGSVGKSTGASGSGSAGVFGATLDAFSKVGPSIAQTVGKFAPIFGAQPRAGVRPVTPVQAGIGIGTVVVVGGLAFLLLRNKGGSSGGTKTNPKKKGKKKSSGKKHGKKHGKKKGKKR